MGERMREYLAALVDGERIDWTLLEQRLGSDSVGLARLRRVAEIIEAFSAGPRGGAHSDTAPGVVWGHLRVFESVGKGSYGEVHRAFDPLLEREVALKLRHDHALQARVFIAEARRLARVRHENVLAVHGAAIHDGRAGLWSDLIVGQSLTEWVAGEGPRPASEILSIASALAAALGAVHAAGLVHGDVKPGNIMREESSGRIVLMDFGSAGDRVDAERHGLLGSPASMAPEQLRGDPVGPSADMYSLGVVLFHLATGAFPVRPAPVPDATTGNVPRTLRGVLFDLLAHEPAARPDAAQLRRRLWDIVDAPRRRRKRIAVGAVIASLAVGLSASIYALVRVEAERAEAVVAREQEAAVSDFLANMLAAPSPTNEGADVRVTEVLDVAARHARERFAGRPRLLLSVLGVIGESYRNLGQWDSARAALTDALALSRSGSGAASEQGFALEATLADVDAQGAPFEQSRDALSSLLTRARTQLGDHHRITVNVALALAVVLAADPGSADELRDVLHSVLDQRPPEDAEHKGQRITALNYLAGLERRAGHRERADALYAEAIASSRELGSEWNINGAAIRAGLALLAQNRGDLVEAERQFRAFLDAGERKFGPAHRNLRIVLLNLGGVLNEQNRFQEAIPFLVRAVELGERYGRPGDSSVRTARINLANALAGSGRLDEARVLREQVYAESLDDPGPDHPRTLIAAINLAEQRLLDGDASRARALAEDAAARAARMFNAQHLFVLEAGEVAARALYLGGEHTQALREMAALCTSKGNALGFDSPHTASCNAHHAELLADAGDRAGASRLLGETIERNAARYGADHPSTIALRERLGTLADGTDVATP